MSKYRLDRISEEVRRELSEILRDEVRDPRISKLTSITSVAVTADLKIAKVRISVFGSEEEKQNTMKGLKAGAGYMRKLLGEKIQLRFTPELVFELDESIEHGAHINELLHQIKKENEDQ